MALIGMNAFKKTAFVFLVVFGSVLFLKDLKAVIQIDQALKIYYSVTQLRGVSFDNASKQKPNSAAGATIQQQVPNKIMVFYNLYVPLNADENTARRIQSLVTEQFLHVANLKEALEEYDNKTITITSTRPKSVMSFNITNIGLHFFHNLSEVVALLTNHDIDVSSSHVEKGDERLTLISLWDHCRAHPEESSIVTYLHSKGTFHPSDTNDLFRSFLTRGATSKTCLEATLKTNTTQDNKNSTTTTDSSTLTCDVCSSRFSPLPHPHTPGNMWTARCSYISQLVDPRNFETEMNRFNNEIAHEKILSNIGAGRFSQEHWVHCHPTVRPCDIFGKLPRKSLYSTGYPKKGQVPNPGDVFPMDLQAAPRISYGQYDIHRQRPTLKLRLAEYERFYNQTPPDYWYGWNFP